MQNKTSSARKFSRERSFSIPTAKVFPLESFAAYGTLPSNYQYFTHYAMCINEIRGLIVPSTSFAYEF